MRSLPASAAGRHRARPPRHRPLPTCSVHKLDKKYYQDGEHAYEMHCKLDRKTVDLPELHEASEPLLRVAKPAPEGGAAAASASADE